MMPNKHAPLTAEEVTDQKALVREGYLARLFDTIEQQREQIAVLTNTEEGGRLQGRVEMVSSIRSSLENYPNYGGDIGVMTEVERIVNLCTQPYKDQIAELEKERTMWLNAIKIALSGEVALIGEPGKPNVVREALEPVDLLIKERDEMKADRDRLDWLEANWLQKVKWITPLESMDGNPLWSTESVPSIGGFQEEITDSLRRSIDLHRECHLLMKERDSLRVELERQWGSEHNEYCLSDYPHDGICHVPKPKYLEESCHK